MLLVRYLENFLQDMESWEHDAVHFAVLYKVGVKGGVNNTCIPCCSAYGLP